MLSMQHWQKDNTQNMFQHHNHPVNQSVKELIWKKKSLICWRVDIAYAGKSTRHLHVLWVTRYLSLDYKLNVQYFLRKINRTLGILYSFLYVITAYEQNWHLIVLVFESNLSHWVYSLTLNKYKTDFLLLCVRYLKKLDKPWL